MFSIVAKNADESDQTRFVQIIEETLQKLVKEGLNQDSLLAGINSAEFRFRKRLRTISEGTFVWTAVYGKLAV